MLRIGGPSAEMHALCRYSVLLPRRLLSQTVSLHSVPGAADHGRLLLSQADAVPPVFLHVVVRGRLLPKTISAVLLARESAIVSLSAR